MIHAVGMNPALDRILIVPGFSVGATLKAESVRIVPSGKGTNVAAVFALLGMPVRHAGFLGAGEEALYHARLGEIPCDFLLVDGRTRTDTTIIDPVTGTETHVREPGFSVTTEQVDEVIERLMTAVAPGDLVAMSGSLPPGAGADAYGRIIRLCRDAGVTTFLDTSEPALRPGVDAVPTLLKPNEVELVELVGHAADDDDSMVNAARELLERGTEAVTVSLGGDGALLVEDGGAWRGWAEAPQVVNTVGCGDAFACGWLAARIRGLEPPGQLREALAVGGANAMCHGAGIIRVEDIETMRSRAHVQRIG